MGDTLSSIIPTSAPPALPVFYNTPEEAAQAYGTTPPALAPQPPPTPAPASTTTALPTFYDTPEQAAQAYPSGQPTQPSSQIKPLGGPVAGPVAAVPAGPTEGGFFSGLISGAGAAATEGARMIQGGAFTTPPGTQPEPQRGFFNELGYGIGHSVPVIGAGLGGGAAGGAVGGPVGAVAGAALGVGGMSFVQDLVPVYDAAIQNGMSHDDAVNYAIKHAAASGVIGAATAPLFEFAPFKNAIGKILFQSLVTQPVAGGAARVGVPLALGEPLPTGQQMVEGLGQDIATGAAFGVGHQVGGRVAAAVRPRETPPGYPEIRIPGTTAEPPPAVSEAPPAPAEAVPSSAPAPVVEEPPAAPTSVPASPVAPEVAPPVDTAEATVAPVAEPPVPPPVRGALPPEPVPSTAEAPPQAAGHPAEPVVEPSLPAPEAVTPAPDDRLGISPGGPGTEAPVGEAGTPLVQPPGEPGRVGGEGDQIPGARGDQTVPAAEAPPVEAAPATDVTQYSASNPHPQSIGAQIDQLEQLGASRTPEQTQQLQDLYQQRTQAETASPERAAKQTQLDQLNAQITALEAQERQTAARKDNAISPSKALLAQRDQLEALYQQRRALQGELQAGAPAENQRTTQAVYGAPPEENLQPGAALADRAVVPGPEPVPTEPPPAGTTGPAEEVQPATAEPTAIAETPTAIAEAPTPAAAPAGEPTQVQKLTATRDALAAKPNLTNQDAAKIADFNRQIDRLTVAQPILDQVIAARRAGIKLPFTGPPQEGRPRDFLDYKFNDGTSVFHEIFREAGHDPDLAVNKPIMWQIGVLTKHMQSKFGFSDVRVVGARSPDPDRVDAKIARDAMLDMTRAVQDGMASLALPHEAASLNGRLSLVIEPEGKRDYYGAYVPGTGEIRIMGGANTFGHEWTHAVDHFLAERLTGNPRQMNDLLTRYARGGLLDPKDGVQAAMAKLINTMFYDQGALAARRLSLELTAQKTNRVGQPTAGALEAQRQLDLLDRAGSQLRIPMSGFRTESAGYHPAKADYFASVYEMLARVHEAYIAREMQNAAVDPRGIVMPDEAYINETDRRLKMTYPKEADRVAIFQALDDLHRAMRNEAVLSEGKPAGAFSDYGISDPSHHPVTAPNTGRTILARAIKAEIARYSNFAQNLSGVSLFDRSRPAAPSERTVSRRFVDAFRAVTFSSHGMMETIIKRAPDEAKAYLTEIMDRLTPAPGEGRYTGMSFEEADRVRSRDWTRRYGNILSHNGIDPNTMTAEQQQMLRHVLVTGEDRFPINPLDPNSVTKAIPRNLIEAGGPLRKLLDEIWRASHDAGLDVGYAKNGFFPRLYDMARIFANPAGFIQASRTLHSTMFDQEIGTPGDNPVALLEKWTTMTKADRGLATGDLPGKMAELNKNLRRQREIEEELNTPFSTSDPAALGAELQTLKGEAQQLAIDAHPLLRDHVAGIASDNWLARLNRGGHHDFDTVGPSGSYLNARVLPPEADIIMRDFMHTNPSDALPNYIHAASRRVAYAERFGAHGEDLERLLNATSRVAGIDGYDLQRFESLVNTVTGRANVKGGMMRDLQKITNILHAVGSIALMPRAVWSALAEPMNAALATGSAQVGFRTFANQFGQLMKTASAKERTEFADLLSVTTSAMHDSIMLSRMAADYSDSPVLNRLMGQYYRVTGLTQLTNSQRTANAAANNWFLAKLAKDYQDQTAGGKRARDDATRWFNELGLHKSIHDEFAQWMVDLKGGMPDLKTLQTDAMKGAYGLAIRRLTDRSIQEPYKVDRAIQSSTPIVGLAFQLMSFNYQFARNVLNPAWGRVEHAYGQAKLEAQAAGAGRLAATAKGLTMGAGAASHAAAMAGTMIGVGLITTALRQALFAPDQWKKHSDDGDLGDYLLGLTLQRSGLNGTLDPILQVFTNLRYNADLSSLLDGASMNWFSKNAMDVIQPMLTTNDSPNTNTRYFNQARGAFNLIGVPAAAYGLTALGTLGGPITRALAGAALQFGTSPGAAAKVAEVAAGPKGAEPAGKAGGLKELKGLKGLQGLRALGAPAAEGGPGGTGAGTGGLIPWGLVDDIALPAWRYGGPMVTRLPGVVKAGALGVGAVAGGMSYLEKTAPFRGQPAPPPKQRQAQ